MALVLGVLANSFFGARFIENATLGAERVFRVVASSTTLVHMADILHNRFLSGRYSYDKRKIVNGLENYDS